MAEYYVVYAGPDVTQFTFDRASTIVEVDGDGELYLWQSLSNNRLNDKGKLLGVFAREHWVAVTTVDLHEDPS